MDEVQKEASNAKSEAGIKRIFVQNKEKIQKERSKLRESMKDSGIKTALATIKSLISIKSPAILETLAFSAAKTPAPTSVPIIVTTAFAQVGYVWVDNRNKQRAEIRESPFAYLYYAEKQKLLE